MKNERRSFIIILSLFLLVVSFVNADNCGGGVQCECGDTLTESQTMWYDLNNCLYNGLEIEWGDDGTVLDCNGHTIDGVGSHQGINLPYGHENIIIKNCIIQQFDEGIHMETSNYNFILNNNIVNNDYQGILVMGSHNNNIHNNTISNSGYYGIFLHSTNYNNFSGNNISNNDYGMWIGAPGSGYAHYNNFWNNRFINNYISSVWEEILATDNNWNLSNIGNYWDDFESNFGYPDYYVIDGHGEGIDWLPNWNFPPTIEPIGDYTIYEGETLIIDVDATDPNNDPLIYYTNAGNILPSTFSFNGITGLIEWTPTLDDAGEYNVTFNVTDGELWDSETVTITVLDGAVHYIDNSDEEFIVISGNWNSMNFPNAYNEEAVFNRNGFGFDRAGWEVNNLVDPATYGVYVWKFEHNYSNLMGTNVHYMIYHRLGTSNWILVNQQTIGNEWIYLGEFEFDNSHRQGVIITDEANGFVIADAIKLVYEGPLSNLDSSNVNMFD